MKTVHNLFRALGVTFEEKALYDILKFIRDKYQIEYTEKKLIKLAENLKLEVDQKSKYTDWAERDDMKIEFYRENFEQAKNFKKYWNEQPKIISYSFPNI